MMSDLDAVRRFALSPDNGMMYEAERGGWVRHGDVAATIERLTAELAAARETARRLMEAERAIAADAERYRWLRDKHPADPESIWVARGLPQTGLSCWRREALDAAIDAAIRAIGEGR
jgi:hypothetical protein